MRKKFELLIVPLKKEKLIVLESIFINRLKEEIQVELKLYNPRSPWNLIVKALLEERN